LEYHAVRNLIIWPMIAQAGLTAAVWLALYRRRIAEMRSRRISPQSIATSRTATALQDVAAADNFRNLFEVPVLFFASCLAVALADVVTPLQLVFAWGFVGFRALHSYIHVTYNRVMHRFTAYVLSTLCVFAMWAHLAVSLWRGG
jgi:hypothetical protein